MEQVAFSVPVHAPRSRQGQFCARSPKRRRRSRIPASACRHRSHIPPVRRWSGPNASIPSQITQLPACVVRRLAAGAIVSSLTTAVAELVENALDASARHIYVDVIPTSGCVTVRDDGCGMSVADGLLLSARCNATSKLRTPEDLDLGVNTLGFRGQALWALAAESARGGGGLSVASRSAACLNGTLVNFDQDGHAVDVRPCAMAVGSVVTVTGLPWRGDETTEKRDMRYCRAWLVREALCFPHVCFRLSAKGRTRWRHDAGLGPLQQTLTAPVFARALKRSPGDFRTASRVVAGIGTIHIVTGLPSQVHFSSRTWVVTSLNGRCVSIEALTRAVISGFDVKKGRCPAAFVSIKTERGIVDWNVSPMKTYACFKSDDVERRIVQEVGEVVTSSLRGVSTSQAELHASRSTEENLSSRASSSVFLNLLSRLPAGSPAGGSTRSVIPVDENGSIDANSASGLLFNAQVVSQVLQTYMLVEYDGGVMLVEQHVAEERVLYERLLREWQSCPFVRLPVAVDMRNFIDDEGAFVLTSLGFEVEARDCQGTGVEDDIHLVHTVPRMLCDTPASELRPLLVRLCHDGNTMEAAAALVSCRLAVKNGTRLSHSKMSRILSGLFKCDNPHTCPHGRPIFLDLRKQDLARLFGRSWSPERIDLNQQTAPSTTNSTIFPCEWNGVLPERGSN